jgi:hypothetical protein
MDSHRQVQMFNRQAQMYKQMFNRQAQVYNIMFYLQVQMYNPMFNRQLRASSFPNERIMLVEPTDMMTDDKG